MTLHQLSCVKRWQVGHRHQHPLEYQLWDLALLAWVLGMTGTPVALLLDAPWAAGSGLGLALVPSAYVALRRRLHRRRQLRCDWLDAASR